MIKVIIDTNFFLIPYQHRIDIFSEIERLIARKYELLTTSNVIRELKAILENPESSGADKTGAKIAFQLIEKKSIQVIKDNLSVDNAMVWFAEKNRPDVIVCTNDRQLKRRLKKRGIRIISMREKNHLDLD
ncbi:MAG TPA: nucleotide-binding protein [Candidatus Altiarchaeales archaeon]|nr:nucleotide-binding protein [Candidatus Altiarchaeales archaeon]